MNRMDESMKMHTKLFRKAPKVEAGPKDFMDMLHQVTYGEVYQIGDLSDKTRELVVITALAVMGAEEELALHINGALNVGVPAFSIREAMYQLSAYVGFPKARRAVTIMTDVFASRGIELTEDQPTLSDGERLTKGGDIEGQLYTEQYRSRYEDMPESLREAVPQLITGWRFGDLYGRTGLDLATRELLALCAIACIDIGKQVRVYYAGAKQAGNSIETIYAALIQCIPFVGLPKICNALHMILKWEDKV